MAGPETASSSEVTQLVQLLNAGGPHVSLKTINIVPEDMDEVVAAIASNPRVTSLSMVGLGSALTPDVASKLATALSEARNRCLVTLQVGAVMLPVQQLLGHTADELLTLKVGKAGLAEVDIAFLLSSLRHNHVSIQLNFLDFHHIASAKAAAVAFSALPTLKWLKLQKAMLPLADLRGDTMKTALDLGNSNLGAVDAILVARMLRHHTGCTSLDLRHNDIGLSGIAAVCDLLAEHPGITSCCFASNHAGNGTLVHVIRACIANKRITDVDVSGNDIQPEEAVRAADLLRTATSTLGLTSLKIGRLALPVRDVIGGPGCADTLSLAHRDLLLPELAFAFSLLRHNRSVTCLDLSENALALAPPLELRGIVDMFRKLLLEGSPSLTDLRLARIDLDPNFMSKLQPILQTCPSLISLDLSNNNLGIQGCTMVSNMMRETPSIQKLLLSGNDFPMMSVEYFAHAILYSPCVKQVQFHSHLMPIATLRGSANVASANFSSRQLGVNDIILMAELLKENQILQRLILTNNPGLTPVTTEKLAIALRSNIALETLKLRRADIPVTCLNGHASQERCMTLSFAGAPLISIDVIMVAQLAVVSPFLEELDLTDVGMDDTGGLHLAALLEASSSLVKLKVSENPKLTTAVGTAMAKAVAKNLQGRLDCLIFEAITLPVQVLLGRSQPPMTMLKLNSSQITRLDMAFLSECLPHNEVLQDLDLSGCALEEQDAVAIASAIASRTRIQVIRLDATCDIAVQALSGRSADPNPVVLVTANPPLPDADGSVGPPSISHLSMLVIVKLFSLNTTCQVLRFDPPGCLTPASSLALATALETCRSLRELVLDRACLPVQTLSGHIRGNAQVNLESSGASIVDAVYISSRFSVNHHLTLINLSHCALDDHAILLLLKAAAERCSVEELNLTYNLITADGITNVARMLKSTPSFTTSPLKVIGVDKALLPLKLMLGVGTKSTLDASNQPFGDLDGILLAEMLTQNTLLSTLKLANCSLSQNGIMALFSGVMGSALTSVDLSGNFLNRACSTALARALTFVRRVGTLRLADCSIDAGSFQLLSPSVLVARIEHLDMQNNALADAGMMVAKELLSNPGCQLTSLKLRRNGISNRGAQLLGQALRLNTSLETLDLSDNDDVGIPGVTDLAQLLGDNNTLIKLTLDNTALPVQDILGHMSTVHLDKLAHSQLSVRDMTLVTEGVLKAHTRLVDLNLSRTELQDRHATVLAHFLSRYTQLETLNLSGNRITDEGAAWLARGLALNLGVTSINLDGNRIGDTGATALSSCLTHNRMLKRITLIDNPVDTNGGWTSALAVGLHVNQRFEPDAVATRALWVSERAAMASRVKEHDGVWPAPLPTLGTLEFDNGDTLQCDMQTNGFEGHGAYKFAQRDATPTNKLALISALGLRAVELVLFCILFFALPAVGFWPMVLTGLAACIGTGVLLWRSAVWHGRRDLAPWAAGMLGMFKEAWSWLRVKELLPSRSRAHDLRLEVPLTGFNWSMHEALFVATCWSFPLGWMYWTWAWQAPTRDGVADLAVAGGIFATAAVVLGVVATERFYLSLRRRVVVETRDNTLDATCPMCVHISRDVIGIATFRTLEICLRLLTLAAFTAACGSWVLLVALLDVLIKWWYWTPNVQGLLNSIQYMWRINNGLTRLFFSSLLFPGFPATSPPWVYMTNPQDRWPPIAFQAVQCVEHIGMWVGIGLAATWNPTGTIVGLAILQVFVFLAFTAYAVICTDAMGQPHNAVVPV